MVKYAIILMQSRGSVKGKCRKGKKGFKGSRVKGYRGQGYRVK
jgi:hypothetical protein